MSKKQFHYSVETFHPVVDVGLSAVFESVRVVNRGDMVLNWLFQFEILIWSGRFSEEELSNFGTSFHVVL